MKHLNLLVSALPLALVCLSSEAWATHKSWLLKDSGATCQPTSSYYNNSFESWTGSITNTGQFRNSVVCPVTLSGRYGASSSPIYGAYFMTQSMRARDGAVYVYDSSSTENVSCGAWVMAQSGGSYYSRSVSSSGTGNATLNVFDKSNLSWGGTMSNSDVAIRSMGYRCFLPQWSKVYGYMVNLCQVTKVTNSQGQQIENYCHT